VLSRVLIFHSFSSRNWRHALSPYCAVCCRRCLKKTSNQGPADPRFLQYLLLISQNLITREANHPDQFRKPTRPWMHVGSDTARKSQISITSYSLILVNTALSFSSVHVSRHCMPALRPVGFEILSLSHYSLCSMSFIRPRNQLT
jgi:hypothetical protein